MILAWDCPFNLYLHKGGLKLHFNLPYSLWSHAELTSIEYRRQIV